MKLTKLGPSIVDTSSCKLSFPYWITVVYLFTTLCALVFQNYWKQESKKYLKKGQLPIVLDHFFFWKSSDFSYVSRL